MRITQEIYEYVYVKLASMKNLVMTANDRSKLQGCNDFESLVELIKRFYPGYSPKELTQIEIERELWRIYFKIIQKLIISSPFPIQLFLKSLLLKYEIWNLKVFIFGVLSNLPMEAKTKQVFESIDELLERKNLFNKLIQSHSIDDIKNAIKNTLYEQVVIKGLEKYQQTKEIFVLEHSLDHFFYEKILNTLDLYPSQERTLIKEYILTNLDYYNINILYRAFYNKIKIREIKPYLIFDGFYFHQPEIQQLYESASLEDFINRLGKYLKGYKKLYELSFNLKDMAIDLLEKFRLELFHQFNMRIIQAKPEEIKHLSIMRIFNLVLIKESNIKAIIRTAQINFTRQN